MLTADFVLEPVLAIGEGYSREQADMMLFRQGAYILRRKIQKIDQTIQTYGYPESYFEKPWHMISLICGI